MVSKNLESALQSVDGLVFHMNHEKKYSITFKIRKRILYAWYLMFLNSIIVKGKLSKTDIKNETLVEISFKQHILWRLDIFTNIFLVLAFVVAIVSGKSSSGYIYLEQ